MSVILLRPLWLLALLPVIAAAVLVRRRRLAGGWAAVVDAEILIALHRLGLLTDGARNRAMLLPFLAAGLIALALSGPAVLRPGAVAWRALDPLILVLDLSPSVVADDRMLAELQVGAARLMAESGGRLRSGPGGPGRRARLDPARRAAARGSDRTGPGGGSGTRRHCLYHAGALRA